MSVDADSVHWLSVVELVGGLFGFVGSILLAVPAVLDLRNRKFWERLDGLLSIKGVTADDVMALRWLILDDILGGYKRQAWCTLGGGAFLAVGFALVVVAGGLRVSGF
jgi:hypothetical protein